MIWHVVDARKNWVVPITQSTRLVANRDRSSAELGAESTHSRPASWQVCLQLPGANYTGSIEVHVHKILIPLRQQLKLVGLPVGDTVLGLC